MPSHKPMPFPWLRPCSYFSINTYVVGKGLLTGTWNLSEEDYNNDGQPEVVITRTRDSQGRIVRVDVVDSRNAQDNKSVLLDYDSEGRVVRYELQQTVRPNITTYEYDIRDRLIRETSTTTSQDGHQATFIANHILGSGGVIASTLVETATGLKREVREFTRWGGLRSLIVFDDQGNVIQDDRFTFDRHQREIKRLSRGYVLDVATGQVRLHSESTVETVFRPRSDRPVIQIGTEHLEIEPTVGVFKWIKASEETTIYAPHRGGQERYEYLMYSPDATGETKAVMRRTKVSQVDSKGRVTEFEETNTNLETEESKSVRSVTVFGTINITTTDLGQDGINEEESVVICDETGKVIASRDGKPDDGPFTNRQTLKYNDCGELSERRTYENDGSIPSRIVKYS